MGVLAVEMEAAGLYLAAAQARKKALGIMTVSDLPLSDESLPALERQNTFDDMVHIALAVALKEGVTWDRSPCRLPKSGRSGGPLSPAITAVC